MPIALVLHGAGFEIDGSQGRKILRAFPDLPAWFLAPSGVTSWSSDDWRTQSVLDISSSAFTDKSQIYGV